MLKLVSCIILTGLYLLGTSEVLAEKPTLTIYTYDSFISDWGPGPKIKIEFEKQCHCQLKFVGLENGVSLLNRLKLEGRHTRADIVLGIDTNLTAEARATHLFAEHGLRLTNSNLPKPWHDRVFLPYDYGYFAFVYNQTQLKQPPASLRALVENEATPNILVQDPRTSTPGLGFLLWIKKIYGDQAPQAWKKLSKKIVTVSKGWSEAYGLFLKGEAPMVLSYTTSPAYHAMIEKDERFAAASFSEGHYLQIEVAGLVASSQQQTLAKAFLRFMLSDRFQNIIPTTNWMYPAIQTDNPLPDAFNRLIQPSTPLLFTDTEVMDKRRQWVNEWLEAMAH